MSDPRPADLTAQEREAVAYVIAAMGGEGEHVDPRTVYRLWSDFSADFSASWLVVDAGTMGNFAAWLIRTGLRSPAPVASPERPAKQVLATVEMEGDRVVYRPAGPETGWLTMTAAHYVEAKRVVTHGFLPTWVVVAMENILAELDAQRAALSAATERAETAERERDEWRDEAELKRAALRGASCKAAAALKLAGEAVEAITAVAVDSPNAHLKAAFRLRLANLEGE